MVKTDGLAAGKGVLVTTELVEAEDDVRAKLPVGERPWSAVRARNASTAEQQQALARERSGAPRRGGRKEQLVEFAVSSGIVTLATVQRLLG